AIALWTGRQAVLSPHVGDLDGPETRQAWTHLVKEFTSLYACGIGLVASDLHPDYVSTRWADEQNWPVVRVQHHHAHAVACMVEHDLLGEEGLAFTWAGTGFGPDGAIGGGEVLRASTLSYDRVAWLRPFPLPGAEAAVREPARIALGLLAQTLGIESVLGDQDLLARLGLTQAKAQVLARMIERQT